MSTQLWQLDSLTVGQYFKQDKTRVYFQMFDHVSPRQGCLELNVISHNKPTFCNSYGCYDMDYFNIILDNSYLTIHNKCILTQYISHNDDNI